MRTPSAISAWNGENINWGLPAPIYFGAGRINMLAALVKELGMTTPLLVTDTHISTLPFFKKLQGYKTFSSFSPNPKESEMEAGITIYKHGKHDGIIALGGGATLDIGKAIGFMQAQSKPVWDFEDKDEKWKQANDKGLAPLIAIPTTSGTGSEAGRAFVLTREKDNCKKIIFHPKIMPNRIILDPELTVSLPANMTAATGMDALSHSLEAYCAKGFHPISHGVSIEGIKLVHDWLPAAYQDGNTIKARGHMMLASICGAVAFQKGLGAVHAMSHPCSSLFDTHHGLTNAVILPYVLSYNRPAIEKAIMTLAAYLNISSGFQGFLQWVIELNHELQIPHQLSDMGISKESLPLMAKMANQDPSGTTNPRPMGEKEYLELYQNAFYGRMER
ncbi:MAG: iron-containing alcohol dehydrogenase [Parvibaculales bacterium]